MTIVIVIVMLKAFSKCYVIVRVWEGGGAEGGHLPTAAAKVCNIFVLFFLAI